MIKKKNSKFNSRLQCTVVIIRLTPCKTNERSNFSRELYYIHQKKKKIKLNKSLYKKNITVSIQLLRISFLPKYYFLRYIIIQNK